MQDAELRTIAKEAYIYGFPIVDNARIQYAYFVDQADPEYKAPWNHLRNIAQVFTPEDTAVQTPNSDTPYSFIGLDLRTEPIVFTAPPIAGERYWSLQLVDLYTHNFDYLGSRNELRVLGPREATRRAPTVAVALDRPGEAVAAELAAYGIMAGGGNFYAVRALQALGIDPEHGVLRLSFTHYTTEAEIAQLIGALDRVL